MGRPFAGNIQYFCEPKLCERIEDAGTAAVDDAVLLRPLPLAFPTWLDDGGDEACAVVDDPKKSPVCGASALLACKRSSELYEGMPFELPLFTAPPVVPVGFIELNDDVLPVEEALLLLLIL